MGEGGSLRGDRGPSGGGPRTGRVSGSRRCRTGVPSRGRSRRTRGTELGRRRVGELPAAQRHLLGRGGGVTALRSGAAQALGQLPRFRSLLVVQAVTIAVVIVAAMGARDTGDFAEQTNWMALAAVAIVVAALAGTSWM